MPSDISILVVIRRSMLHDILITVRSIISARGGRVIVWHFGGALAASARARFSDRGRRLNMATRPPTHLPVTTVSRYFSRPPPCGHH